MIHTFDLVIFNLLYFNNSCVNSKCHYSIVNEKNRLQQIFKISQCHPINYYRRKKIILNITVFTHKYDHQKKKKKRNKIHLREVLNQILSTFSNYETSRKYSHRIHDKDPLHIRRPEFLGASAG